MNDNFRDTNNYVELNWPDKYLAGGARRRPDSCGYDIADAQCEGRTLRCVSIQPQVVERFELLPGMDMYSSHGRLLYGDMRAVVPVLDDESVDFTYVDPPFFSNRDWNLKSSCRDHEESSSIDGWGRNINNKIKKKINRKTVAYSDRWILTEYINFLDDLIQMVKPKLKHSGVIAVHTDYRASAYVRLLLEEHFGYNGMTDDSGGFVNELIWKYGLGNANAKRYFLRKHDTIAVYAKSRDYYFKPLMGPASKAQLAKYCHVEEETGRKYMLSYGRKYYFKGGKPLESVLDIPALSATSGERCGYPTQKPTALLHTLIEAFCPAGGTVLDPCCGSGTTAVAAADLGCNWITCDSQMLAVHTARKRLALGGNCRFSLETIGNPHEAIVNNNTNAMVKNDEVLVYTPDLAEDPCPRIFEGEVIIEPHSWIDAWGVGYIYGKTCVPCISSYSGRFGKDKKPVDSSLPINCGKKTVSAGHHKYSVSHYNHDNNNKCSKWESRRIFNRLSSSGIIDDAREDYRDTAQIAVGFWNYLGNKYQIILPN